MNIFEKIQLEEGERILRTVRRHWFVIVSELFVAFIMVSLPFLVLVAFSLNPTLHRFLEMPIPHLLLFTTFGIAAWSLISIMFGYMIWTHYFLDLWIITDRRLIAIEQVHFFNRMVSSFRLERLQDLTVSIDGLLHTFLNFGTIRAQTAASGANTFIMRGLPDPRGILAVIQEATDKRLDMVGKSGQTT